MSHHTIGTLVHNAAKQDASPLFLALLATGEPQDRHHLRQKVGRAIDGGALETAPDRWGHFATAAWRGDRETAWNRADLTNRALMETAGFKL